MLNFRNTKKPLNIIIRTFHYNSTHSIPEQKSERNCPSLSLKNVLILNKVTRYEFERKRYSNHDLLKHNVQKSGTDYDRLLQNHDRHYKSLDLIVKAFQEQNINVKVTQRFGYSKTDIDKADAIITAGGDGTFLLASLKIQDSNKPIIGINTDYSSSEGRLLLKKSQSSDFSKVLRKILNGEFKYQYRSRIRITLEGDSVNLNPIELHDQVLNEHEYRFIEHITENRNNKMKNASEITQKHVLPLRSLNEVFIGEALSARVSYYKMSINDGAFFKQKSSGLLVCTGTGSTSWCYNINKISHQSIEDMINIINRKLRFNNIPNNESFVTEVMNEFNDSIVFSPSDLRMAYTIRDPIINRIFTNETNRGFARKLVIQSRCFDASLVIDGSISYQFNAGTKATLEIFPEDSLKTIVVDE